MPYLKLFLVILRVPGILLVDIWWQNELNSIIPKAFDIEEIADSGLNFLPAILALCILLLPIEELSKIYMHIIAAGAMAIAIFSAQNFLEGEIYFRAGDNGDNWRYFVWRHVTNAATLVTMNRFIRWSLDIQHVVFREICPTFYLIPLVVSFFGVNSGVLRWLNQTIHIFTTLFVGVYGIKVLSKSMHYINITLRDYNVIRNELGLGAVALVVRRMFEPLVLATYFIVQLLAQVWSDFLELEDKKFLIKDTDWLVQCLVSLSEVCYSPLMLISMCIVIMGVSNFILNSIQHILSHCSNVAAAAGQPVLPSGITEGIVTFVLGLQTGLTDMEMPGRVGAISIIMFVVLASLLQSCLDVTYPVLLSVPAVNRRLSRHLVPVVLTLLLMLVPILMVYQMLTFISSELWTLVIISSCLVTAVQALGHLATYCIIVWDCSRETPSANTDDYIFGVKAATKFGELLLAVLVVGGGFYESFALDSDKDWSAMNMLVLVSHCYLNIYTRVTQGWSQYLARRETSKRLSSLEVATEAQLRDHGDVCSICYMPMEAPSAVITHCQHFFHSHCLKKWLVVQDNCPLCTKPVVAVNEEKEVDDGQFATDSEEEEQSEPQNDNVVVEEQATDAAADNNNHDQQDDQVPKNESDFDLRFRGSLRNQNIDLFEGD